MKTIWLVAFSVAFLVAGLGGCASLLESGSVRAFPTSSKPATGGDMAQGLGQLILKDGCLRLGSTDSPETASLIQWPYGYSYQETSNGINILDSEGQLKASLGDRLELTGGGTEEGIPGVPCNGPTFYAWSVKARPDTAQGIDR